MLQRCSCIGRIPIALQHEARYIVAMDSRSPSITACPARLIAILSPGLLLRTART